LAPWCFVRSFVERGGSKSSFSQSKANEVIEQRGASIVSRAASFLLLADSRASFRARSLNEADWRVEEGWFSKPGDCTPVRLNFPVFLLSEKWLIHSRHFSPLNLRFSFKTLVRRHVF
jgi:hypothetical protein